MYFRGGLFFLGGISAFSIQASDGKLYSAFRQMLLTVPLLRTCVVGGGEDSEGLSIPFFQAIKDPDKWPKLKILDPAGTDVEALAHVRAFKSVTEAMLLQDEKTQKDIPPVRHLLWDIKALQCNCSASSFP